MKRWIGLLAILFIISKVYSEENPAPENKIIPFFRTEFGIGFSGVIYTGNINNANIYLGTLTNILAGIQVKNLSFSSGLGVSTFGSISHQFFELSNSDRFEFDIYSHGIYLNIPLLFAWKIKTKGKIYPAFEIGLNNLFFLGDKYKFKHDSYPFQPPNGFNSVKDYDVLKIYLPALSASAGFGIQLKKGFLYELNLNYLQIIAGNYKIKKKPDGVGQNFPYQFGIKTGFIFNFKGKS